MTDPRRIADGGEHEELAELVRSAQKDLPSKSELSALAASLGPLVGGGVGGSGAAGSAGAGAAGKAGGGAAAAAGGNALGYKVLIGLIGLGVVGGLAVYVVMKTNSEQPSNSPNSLGDVAPAAAVSAGARAPANTLPKLNPSSTSSSQEAPAPSVAPSASAKHAPKIPSEAQLLQQARAALKSDPKRALSLTRMHQRHYPRGVLTQEREVLAIEALKRLGDESAAKERASTFEKAHPGSAHLPKLKGVSKPKAPKK